MGGAVGGWVISALTLVLALPFALTLHTVREPRPLIMDLAANPTPLGYTWSLSRFLLPVPYQWWGFQSRSRVGRLINGFCGLPIEEPLLWIGVTWAAIILYETISTWNFQRAEARAAALMTERSEFR